MTLCPVAIAVGCKRCPLFAVCPVKTVIGDYRPGEHPTEKPRAGKRTGAAAKRRS